ncbi:MAG: cardiolipin synthase, partial [Oscillospiraceae bacterium]|nr:cardiolipin synthase [Oscillospiraceae bacterium]
DNEMVGALTYAAKRGVDVIIIMPHIPDKVYAYLLARSYYAELIRAGVKIYEYTPGFVHAKCFVSDDTRAVVGSINLDYRSLFLHFECASYFYRHSVVTQVEQDVQNTLKKCMQVTIDDCKKFNIFKRIAGHVLRLFAPLM